MVTILFLLVLLLEPSWLEEITEKSLADMLDQIIDETILSSASNEDKNNSKIYYVKPGNPTIGEDFKLNTEQSEESEDLKELVNQIEKSKQGSVTNSGENDNTGPLGETQDPNNETPVSGRRTNKITILTSDTESNLIHKYPEIIIDKISYNVGDNVEPKIETLIRHSNVKHLTKEEKKEVAAKTLGSLVKIIVRETQIGKKLHDSIEDPDDTLRRSTHIHNAYHNHVINTVPLPYSGLLAARKIPLGELPQGYRALQSILSTPSRTVYHHPNLQLNRWGNAAPNPLMSIQRAHNLDHVHFIPDTFNIMPRIVYGFQRKYPG